MELAVLETEALLTPFERRGQLVDLSGTGSTARKVKNESIKLTASSGETPTTPIARCSNGCATTLVTH